VSSTLPIAGHVTVTGTVTVTGSMPAGATVLTTSSYLPARTPRTPSREMPRPLRAPLIRSCGFCTSAPAAS
jgi:hypothetical protein